MFNIKGSAMYTKMTAALVGLALFGAVGTAAEAVTIDFGATGTTSYTPGSTYTEDGFTFTITSGSEWGINAGFGNPASSLTGGALNPIGIGDTISIKRAAGGLFTFDMFDFASINDGFGLLSDAFDLVGLLSASVTETLASVTSSSDTFATIAPSFATSIDELRIVGVAQNDAGGAFDNFVFTEIVTPPTTTVPEPGTLALFGLGLAGLGYARRKKVA